jgi:hypothetical protein
MAYKDYPVTQIGTEPVLKVGDGVRIALDLDGSEWTFSKNGSSYTASCKMSNTYTRSLSCTVTKSSGTVTISGLNFSDVIPNNAG